MLFLEKPKHDTKIANATHAAKPMAINSNVAPSSIAFSPVKNNNVIDINPIKKDIIKFISNKGLII
jgi:hypothetical protein